MLQLRQVLIPQLLHKEGGLVSIPAAYIKGHTLIIACQDTRSLPPEHTTTHSDHACQHTNFFSTLRLIAAAFCLVSESMQ